MTRLFLSSMLAIVTAACVDPASDPPPFIPQPAVDDPGSAKPSSDVRSLEPAARSTPPSSEGRPPLTTQVAGTWNQQYMDICQDWFLQYCFANSPTPQCPAAPDGKPCSPAGSFCYQTVNRQNFRYYTCD
jgi:hypothetical protein